MTYSPSLARTHTHACTHTHTLVMSSGFTTQSSLKGIRPSRCGKGFSYNILSSKPSGSGTPSHNILGRSEGVEVGEEEEEEEDVASEADGGGDWKPVEEI